MSQIEITPEINKAIFEVMYNSKKPVVWVAPRRVGKTTILSKIAAQALCDNTQIGDIWIIAPNNVTDIAFFKHIIKQLPKTEELRSTRSRLELLSNANRIVTLRSMPRETNGLRIIPPKMIIFDEISIIPIDAYGILRKCFKYDEISKIKIVAATTPSNQDYLSFWSEVFGEYEIIDTLNTENI